MAKHHTKYMPKIGSARTALYTTYWDSSRIASLAPILSFALTWNEEKQEWVTRLSKHIRNERLTRVRKLEITHTQVQNSCKTWQPTIHHMPMNHMTDIQKCSIIKYAHTGPWGPHKTHGTQVPITNLLLPWREVVPVTRAEALTQPEARLGGKNQHP